MVSGSYEDVLKRKLKYFALCLSLDRYFSSGMRALFSGAGMFHFHAGFIASLTNLFFLCVNRYRFVRKLFD